MPMEAAAPAGAPAAEPPMPPPMPPGMMDPVDGAKVLKKEGEKIEDEIVEKVNSAFAKEASEPSEFKFADAAEEEPDWWQEDASNQDWWQEDTSKDDWWHENTSKHGAQDEKG